ncbi:unnamed protein product [Notodromas monacha]|uniref:Transmembrane protein 256 n=1 Tax=Notodromas monacha TaxID=399045 RepID=A0A7R9BFK4_9CRUS|nr:unnamed protein product [Notodromas monacha]CAG0913733.1 unnamed protein product [Notodromas monacha]
MESEIDRFLETVSSMSLSDAVNFVIFDNPVSKTFGKILTDGLLTPRSEPMGRPRRSPVPMQASNDWLSQGRLSQILGASGNWTRVAGLSGALAVILGAYGSHSPALKQVSPEKRAVFETANRYHFFHSIALLGVPLCRRPMITGSLMFAGMLIFSGSCYGYALTNYQDARRVTPFGGILLIVSWLSMIV